MSGFVSHSIGCATQFVEERRVGSLRVSPAFALVPAVRRLRGNSRQRGLGWSVRVRLDGMTEDTRWRQRLDSLLRALALLREPFARGIGTLTQLEKEGTVQRFEFVFELAWNAVKDYLQFQGAQIPLGAPRSVLKAAFSAGILADGQVWIDMLNHRNLMAHTYDAQAFDEAVHAIAARYLPAFELLASWLVERSRE